jgi:hypothetical protein
MLSSERRMKATLSCRNQLKNRLTKPAFCIYSRGWRIGTLAWAHGPRRYRATDAFLDAVECRNAARLVWDRFDRFESVAITK